MQVVPCAVCIVDCVLIHRCSGATLDRLEILGNAADLKRIRASKNKSLKNSELFEYDNDFQTGFVRFEPNKLVFTFERR